MAAGCGGDDDEGEAGGTGTEAGGEAKTVKIVSDLPLQGSSAAQTESMNNAIQLYLQDIGNKVGNYTIEFEAFDDSTAAKGAWDEATCAANARKYIEDESIVGVIGTFNSGCAKIEVPILNEASLAIVSPANTATGLTHEGPGAESGEPDKYYPTGVRNYARVAPPDKYQGAAMAEFAVDQGVESVYILNDRESYGLGVATNFRNAAEHLGIEIKGFEAYDATASSYEALFRGIGQTDPDAVFVGGLIDENAGQLIEDKVKVLGPNAGDVTLLLPDGFTTDAIFDPAEGGTPDAKDAFFSVAGVPTDEFKGAGAEFASAFQEEKLGGDPVDPYAIYAAQAAQVMIDAIAEAGDDRAAIIDAIFATEVTDGLIGTFSFDENGDPTGAEGAVVGFTIYTGTDALESVTTIAPQPENVEAAAGGAS
jgi:branched-chain amino acid transport system substrate-binding protein